MTNTIPFTKPYLSGNELKYISECVESGNIAADGYFTNRCSELLGKAFGIPKVLMTPSGTSALEIATQLCNLEPGDEVILPSFTFVSTANAIIKAGGKPVFVDIRPDTLNLDEKLLEAAITSKTKAVIPVHYGGTACEMNVICEIAKKHDLFVIEDAAQGVNASYRNQKLGSIGRLGAFSFHHTKNYVCGEGGALCINDKSLIEPAEILREKGTNRTDFVRGRTDKYTWVTVGSSHILSEVVGAFLYAQLEKLEWITSRRREIYERYSENFQRLERSGAIHLPVIPEDCETNYHIFYLILPSPHLREDLTQYLGQSGIEASFHYVPLHSSPMGKSLGYVAADLPTTQDLSARLLRLPIYPGLKEDQQRLIVDLVESYFEKRVTNF